MASDDASAISSQGGMSSFTSFSIILFMQIRKRVFTFFEKLFDLFFLKM